MSAVKLNNGMISDVFSFDSKYGQYTDAIVMPEEEYNLMSETQISDIKQERFNNWIFVIENPKTAE